ncbi:uncharacterized protein V1518DRAFT_404545 [Limtongia smithiae]|uniref:uncharacterized protein n=1 Tax=Limtongia smithiae TaxID=1125753 RepID=UPI0034CF4A9E
MSSHNSTSPRHSAPESDLGRIDINSSSSRADVSSVSDSRGNAAIALDSLGQTVHNQSPQFPQVAYTSDNARGGNLLHRPEPASYVSHMDGRGHNEFARPDVPPLRILRSPSRQPSTIGMTVPQRSPSRALFGNTSHHHETIFRPEPRYTESLSRSASRNASPQKESVTSPFFKSQQFEHSSLYDDTNRAPSGAVHQSPSQSSWQKDMQHTDKSPRESYFSVPFVDTIPQRGRAETGPKIHAPVAQFHPIQRPTTASILSSKQRQQQASASASSRRLAPPPMQQQHQQQRRPVSVPTHEQTGMNTLHTSSRLSYAPTPVPRSTFTPASEIFGRPFMRPSSPAQSRQSMLAQQGHKRKPFNRS